MLKIKNTCFNILILALVAFTGCTQNQSNITPIGSYCGKADQPFENPISNQNIDASVFEVIVNPPAEKYRADEITMFLKKSDSDEQVMYSHRPVYQEDTLSLKSFRKSCSRGITPESTGLFQAELPVEITINEDSTWKASQALSYKVEYGKALMDKGFLNGSVEDTASPAPSAEQEFGFLEFLYLNQIGNLNKAQTASKANPETALDEILMQIKISETPEAYARIKFKKLAKPISAEL